MVSDVNIGSVLTASQKTDAASNKLADDFSQFLTLLTVQLQHQDPLSPMDTTEFTNQLVAFTGVEQQINTNQKLDSLVALGLGTAYSGAQNYVGKEISYISSEFEHTGAPSKVRYSLENVANISKIYVYNEQGEIVYSADAEKGAGAHEFIWDGTLNTGGLAAPGTYEVKIDALDANENSVKTSSVVTGIVRGTESQNGQIFLIVGERAVAMSNVLNTTQQATSGANDALTSALSYVGLDVNYINTSMKYDGATPEDVIYSLPTKADRAKIMIFDDKGTMVYSENVDTGKGRHLFRWDGRLSDGTKAAAGDYNFVIDALDAGDKRIDASSVSEGRVTGVETKNGQIFLSVGNNSVNLRDVLSVDVPGEDT